MNRQVRQLVDSFHEPDLVEKRQLLCEAVERDLQELLGTIQVYVKKSFQKFGLNTNRQSIETLANEIMHETVETALKKAKNFDSSRSPTLWLLGIANKKIQRWQRKRIQESKRITPIAEIPQVRRITQQPGCELMSEDEIFGLLYQCTGQPDPYRQLVLDELLSLVEDRYKKLLRLSYIEGLQGQSLAAALGITVNNAYVQLSRARNELRKAHQRSEQQQKGEG